METLRNDANHTSVAKEQSTTFGDVQYHAQIRLSAEGGHILWASLWPEWGTHLDRPDWSAWSDHTLDLDTCHQWRCHAWWHLAPLFHKDSWLLTSDPPSGLPLGRPSGLWAALRFDMLLVACTERSHTRLGHTLCSLDHWGLRSFPLRLDNLLLNILMMRDIQIRLGTPMPVDTQYLDTQGQAYILVTDIRLLVGLGSWEVVVGNQK